MHDSKKSAALVMLALTMLLTLTLIPPTRAQFVIATWDYPDAYGQGINGISILENTTGSWEYTGDGCVYNDGSQTLPWNASVPIMLEVITSLNGTLTGASSLADGKKYHQHSIIVTGFEGSVVFSQQNFTYNSGAGTGNPYWYVYRVILEFLPLAYEVYTVIITYEVFY